MDDDASTSHRISNSIKVRLIRYCVYAYTVLYPLDNIGLVFNTFVRCKDISSVLNNCIY